MINGQTNKHQINEEVYAYVNNDIIVGYIRNIMLSEDGTIKYRIDSHNDYIRSHLISNRLDDLRCDIYMQLLIQFNEFENEDKIK